MKEYSLFTILILSTTISCTYFSKNALAELQTENKHTVALEDAFDVTRIVKYRNECTREEKLSGQQVFLKALDEYRNKNNAIKAEPLLLQSIAIFPTANAYFELGNVYSEKNDYEKALASYNMADALGYEPISKVLYNMACVYSRKKDIYFAKNYLEYALEAGYKNFDQIKNDVDLINLRSSNSYLEMIDSVTEEVESPKEIEYVNFVENFALIYSFPYIINEKVLDDYTEEQDISYTFEPYVTEMRTIDRYSREVGKSFFYLAAINTENANYNALVYKVWDYTSDVKLDYAYLVTYSPQGKLIDKMLIAGLKNSKENVLQSTFISNQSFIIDSYKSKIIKIENNPQQVTKDSKVDSILYDITSDGKIVKRNTAML